jgi:hypothetical protein
MIGKAIGFTLNGVWCSRVKFRKDLLSQLSPWVLWQGLPVAVGVCVISLPRTGLNRPTFNRPVLLPRTQRYALPGVK